VRWKQTAVRAAIALNQARKRIRYRLHVALGGPGPISIVAYRGYGTPAMMHLKGRVVVRGPIRPATPDDSTLRNLSNLYRRARARAIPHARLRLRFQEIEKTIACDQNGYFETWFSPNRPLDEERVWHEVELELLRPRDRRQARPVRTVAKVLVPPRRARSVVISDVDDTVVKTGATRLFTLLRETFLGNEYSRLPFPGVGAFYRALRDGAGGDERNPTLYVSRSPWTLYDLLSNFFELHRIPIGPVLFLREWGLSAEGLTRADVEGLKYKLIDRMLAVYSDLPFILIGDSGQKDPEVYHALIKRHPGRVLAVYIRNVSLRPERPEALRSLARDVADEGCTLILADDSVAMAEHAAARGWIDPGRLVEIRSERARDEAPGLLEQVLQRERAEGPTAEVAAQGEPGATRRAIDAGAVEQALLEGDEASEQTPTVVLRPEESRPPG
jgi:phosphatidate phosphatase APP1